MQAYTKREKNGFFWEGRGSAATIVRNLPKYEVNPLMQMSRYVLTLQSLPMLMNKINWIFSPSRELHSIW
jgi:hypothetical protein